MYPSRATFIGTLCIIVLVAAFHWHADISAMPDDAEPFKAAAPGRDRGGLVAVRTINWSADGRSLMARSRDWNGHESVVLHTVPAADDELPLDITRQSTSAAALAPDGRHVLVGTIGGELCWIDVNSLETISLIELTHPAVFTAIVVAADGQTIAAATDTGRIFAGDPQQGAIVELETDQASSILDLRFSHEGQSLVSSHADGMIGVWDLTSHSRRLSLQGHCRHASAAAFLPGGRKIVSVGHDDRVCLWDIASGCEEWHGECGLSGVLALAVSPNGKWAACGGYHRRIVVWDLESRRQRTEFMTEAAFIQDLQFSFDGSTLAAAGREDTIRFFDMRSGTEKPGLIASTTFGCNRGR